MAFTLGETSRSKSDHSSAETISLNGVVLLPCSGGKARRLVSATSVHQNGCLHKVSHTP